MLGISAAIWGGWLEHAGPRKAGFMRRIFWGGGLVLLGLAVTTHQLWLVYLVAFFCGIGQGIGYITPVSTLIKWFPDRRGMATGFAIMGYGGGAMIGAPLAVWLMAKFASNGIPGVAPALMIMGVLYFIAMSLGAFGFRVTPAGWLPAGWTPPAASATKSLISHNSVHLNECLEDAAVLVHLGRPVLQRDGRHRRDLDGEPDVPGHFRRASSSASPMPQRH